MAAPVSSVPVFNALTGLLPCEGAKAMPFVCDFSVTTEYDFDFTLQKNQGQFSTVQGIYVDNSLNASPLQIEVGGTLQNIVVKKQTAGYYTLLTTGNPTLRLISAGGVVVKVVFINFYVPPTVWDTQ